MRTTYTVILALLLTIVTRSTSTTHRVPQDFATIQLAINAAINGDTILVAEGMYLENILITKKIVVASRFILDGDTTHISRTIIDGSSPSHTDSAAVVTLRSGTDSTSTIIGFTITGGKGSKHFRTAMNSFIYSGGGIDVYSGGATIRHNIITGNFISTNSSLAWGGGIAVGDPEWPIDNSYVIIENNAIVGNSLATNILSMCGGIGFCGSDGRIINNTVSNNIAQYVGGIAVKNEQFAGVDTVLVEGNLVQGNRASINIGGIYLYGGGTFVTFAHNVVIDNLANLWYGGVAVGDTCSATVESNYIARNSCSNGGALYFYSNPKNTLAVNNIITSNSGNGIVLGYGSSYRSSALVINNTIVGNSGAGIYANTNSKAYAMNNILKNAGAPEIGGTVYTAHNLAEGGGLTGVGDINGDPLFVADDSLYHLSNASPCIGAGIASLFLNDLTLTAPASDYCNAPRPQAAGTNPDMGAVECMLNTSTSILSIQSDVPTSFELAQNYPNPFNPSTMIRYSLPTAANVKLTIHDILGREIATLVNEEQSSGWKEVQWNATGVSSGIYFYELRAGNFVSTKRLVLLR